MAANRGHEAENDAERERLIVLVSGLDEAALGRAMPAGWTVAAVLAHLAFWDARALFLLDKWAGGTPPSKADYEPEDVDWVNDAGKPLCLALPPGRARELALRIAVETDGRVKQLSDEMLAMIRAAGSPFNLSRADHRREHLDDIERALRAG